MRIRRVDTMARRGGPELLVAFALLSLLGCQRATVEQRLVLVHGGNQPEAQMEFWHQLADQRRVSNDDAFHGLLLLAEGEDPAASYEERVALLKERGWLYDRFDEPGDHAVTRGVVATAVARILEIKGGLTMRLVGPVPRYAVRELMYENLYPPSSPRQPFSGTEFLGVISRVEDYQFRQAYLAAQKAGEAPSEGGSAPPAPPDVPPSEGGAGESGDQG